MGGVGKINEGKNMNSTEIQKEIERLQAELRKQSAAQADPIQEHLDKARELTPSMTRVTEPAFEQLLRAFEKLRDELRKKGSI